MTSFHPGYLDTVFKMVIVCPPGLLLLLLLVGFFFFSKLIVATSPARPGTARLLSFFLIIITYNLQIRAQSIVRAVLEPSSDHCRDFTFLLQNTTAFTLRLKG